MVPVLSAMVVGGCLTPSPSTTWLDDQFDEGDYVRPRRRPPQPDPIADETSDFETRDDDEARPPWTASEEPPEAPSPAAVRATLERFTPWHREYRPEHGGRRWPSAVIAVWRALLADLTIGLTSPKVTSDPHLLLQMRRTVATELKRGTRRFGAPPADLVASVRLIYIEVNVRLSRMRPPSQRHDSAPVELAWPVSPQRVTSPFGYRRDPIRRRGRSIRFHAGIDLGGRPGMRVTAAAPGQVVDAGWSGGHGRRVKLRHRNGLFTTYAHLQRALVRSGQWVERGDTIGLMGSSGRATGPHLHFEVRRGNVPIDPLELLSTPRRRPLRADRFRRFGARR